MEEAEEEANLSGLVTPKGETNSQSLYPSLQHVHNEDENAQVNAQGNRSSPVPPIVSSFNLWEVNCYKRTVRRIDDGAKLCDDLLKLLAERAEIEGLYAAKLQGWSKKWNDIVNKGSEYGHLKNSWIRLTEEAEQLAGIHSDRQNNLLNQVHGNVLGWKSANYHKSLLSWRETKNAEEGFSKAQKPWAKKSDEVTKCKRAYYQSCRASDQAERVYKEASVEGNTITEDQVKKFKDKADKASLDVKTAREKYEESIRDITNYNPKYEEDMRYVFSKCQDSEGRRKSFFKESFLNFCDQMELSQYYDRMSSIYKDLRSALETTDVSADISWWASTFGSEMPTRLVKFEEYIPGQEVQQTPANAIQQHQQPAVTPSSARRESQGSPSNKKSSVCAAL